MDAIVKPILYGIGWIIAFMLGIDRYYLGKEIKQHKEQIEKLDEQLTKERRDIQRMRDTYEKALREITGAIQDENMRRDVDQRLDKIFADAKQQAINEQTQENADRSKL